MLELSDKEVFREPELSDAEVFGRQLTDAEVFNPGMHFARNEAPLGGPTAAAGQLLTTAGKLAVAGLAELGDFGPKGPSPEEREASRRPPVPWIMPVEGGGQQEVLLPRGLDIQDVGKFPTAEAPEEGTDEPQGNIEAALRGETLPAESQLKVLPTAARVVGRAGQGLAESAPRIAAMAGLSAAGVPPPVAAGLSFGTTPEGFDPKQAAVAAALPFAGRYSGEIVGAVAKRLGVSGAEALQVWKAIGGVSGAAGYLGLIDESEIEQLPPALRNEARIEMVAGLIGQSALGPMGLLPEPRTGRLGWREALMLPEKTPTPEAAPVVRLAGGGELPGPEPAVQTPGPTPPTLAGAGTVAGEPTPKAATEPAPVTTAPSSEPLTTIERKYLEEDLREHKPVSAELLARAGIVPAAMNKGWRLEGETWVWEAPAPEKSAADLAYEARVQANRELAAMKAAEAAKEEPVEDPDWTVPGAESEPPYEEPLAPHTELAVPGVPIEWFGERAPDVLDWIEGNFPSGVKVPNAGDYGEYHKRAHGRAKELLRMTSGEAPDLVLKEMHEQGQYRRIDSVDDLLEAMVRAGDTRIGEREQRRQTRVASSKAEAWADEVLRGGGTHAGPDVLAAYVVKGAAVLERLAVKSFEAFKEAFEKLYPEAVQLTQHIYERANRLLKEVAPEGKAWQDKNAAGQLNETPTAGRLDGLAQIVHGNPYADLEEWQQNAIRQAVEARPERETVRGREQPGVSGGRERYTQGDILEPRRTAAKRAWQRELQRTAAEQRAERRSVGERYLSRRQEDYTARLGELDAARREREPAVSEILAKVRDEKGDLNLRAFKRLPAKELDQVFGLERIISESNRVRALRANLSTMVYPGTEGAVERWLNGAIERTNLGGAQLLEGVFGAPVWLTKTALNGLLRVVRGAYRGGKALGAAIEEGLTWLRAQNVTGYNEGEAKEFLQRNLSRRAWDDDLNFREFLDQVDKSGPVETSEAAVNRLYQRRTNESDAAFATRILTAVGGPERGQAVFADSANGLPGSVRMFLGQLIVKQLSEAGQHEAAARFLDDVFAPATTDIAQSLQALAAWAYLTPAGKVAWAQRKIARAIAEVTGRVAPNVEAAGSAVDRIGRDGIEQTVVSPEVQRVAREAINAAVEADPDVHRAVIMDMAEPWASSPEIVGMARAQVRAKANELLNRKPQPPGLRPQERLRAIMDDLAQRAAGIAASFFQGQVVHADGLAGLYQERLGLDAAHARRLAAGMEREFEKQVAKARATLPRRIARVRANLETADGLDAAIRRAIRTLQLDLGRIVREHFTVGDAAGRRLAEHLVQETGLGAEPARRLAEAVERRFAELVAQRRAQELHKILKPVPVRGRKELVQRLVELSNLGALGNEKVWNAVRERMDLPAWTPELARRLTEIAERLQRLPADQVEARQRASIEFLNEVERARGVTGMDLALGFYITNILTGVTTHAKNVISTTLNAIGAITGEHLRALLSGRLDDVPLMYEALARGARAGVGYASEMMRTGHATGSRLQKLEAGRPLELTRFGQRGGVPVRGKVTRAILENRLAGFLNAWKYNYRLMGAEDMLLFKPVEEMKAALLAKRMARTEGLSGEAAADRARQILGYGLEGVRAANARAAQEGLTGGAARRRAAELLQLSRPEELREDAVQYALRTTFNNRPYGTMGALAGIVDRAKASPNGALRVGATLTAPFTSIVANVANESLNYSPWGFKRAAARSQLAGHEVSRLSAEQRADLRAELAAKATMGTLALSGLAVYAASQIDQPNPDFAVYGAGPLDDADRKGWRAAGGLPHSLKIGGRYYSYATTPMAIPMAAVGNVFDRMRDARQYKSRSAAEAMESLPTAFAVALLGAGRVITEQSFLSGMTSLASLVTERQPEVAARAFWKQVATIGTSGVVPNALRQVDRFFDPQVYDARNLQEILVNATPFVRGAEGRPALNALGLPVTTPISDVFTKAETADPLVKILNERGLFPSVPDRNHVWPRTGRTMTDDEFYQYVAQRGRVLYGWLEGQRQNGQLTRLNDQAASKLVSTLSEKAGEVARAKIGF